MEEVIATIDEKAEDEASTELNFFNEILTLFEDERDTDEIQETSIPVSTSGPSPATTRRTISADDTPPISVDVTDNTTTKPLNFFDQVLESIQDTDDEEEVFLPPDPSTITTTAAESKTAAPETTSIPLTPTAPESFVNLLLDELLLSPSTPLTNPNPSDPNIIISTEESELATPQTENNSFITSPDGKVLFSNLLIENLDRAGKALHKSNKPHESTIIYVKGRR